MQVLETDPLSLLSCILDKLEGDFILATAHGKLVEVLPSYNRLCKLLKLTARIGTWRDDEENGLQWRGFVLVNIAKSKRRWLNVLSSKRLLYEVLHGRL
jgi:hypothetical protein